MNPKRRPLHRHPGWIIGGIMVGTAFGLTGLGNAADHRDSALLTGDPAADVADVFAFRSPTNSSNLVLAMTVSGLTPPSETGSTFFDPDVLYQIHIDTNGDAIEDRVIQAYATGSGSSQQIHFRGPASPVTTGTTFQALPGSDVAIVALSQGSQAIQATGGNLRVFAGMRDDPFFFDLGRFNAIVAGEETSFRDPGIDALAGTNVLALVVELPISTIGSGPLGVWATTSRRIP